MEPSRIKDSAMKAKIELMRKYNKRLNNKVSKIMQNMSAYRQDPVETIADPNFDPKKT